MLCHLSQRAARRFSGMGYERRPAPALADGLRPAFAPTSDVRERNAPTTATWRKQTFVMRAARGIALDVYPYFSKFEAKRFRKRSVLLCRRLPDVRFHRFKHKTREPGRPN